MSRLKFPMSNKSEHLKLNEIKIYCKTFQKSIKLMDNRTYFQFKNLAKFPHDVSSINYDSKWLGSSRPFFPRNIRKNSFQSKDNDFISVGVCLDLHFWCYLL